MSAAGLFSAYSYYLRNLVISRRLPLRPLTIPIAIATVSILAPLAFVPTGASGKSISRSSGHSLPS